MKVLVCLPSQNCAQFRRLETILQVIEKASLVKESLELKYSLCSTFLPSALEAHRGNRALALPTLPQWAQRKFHINTHSWSTSAQMTYFYRPPKALASFGCFRFDHEFGAHGEISNILEGVGQPEHQHHEAGQEVNIILYSIASP